MGHVAGGENGFSRGRQDYGLRMAGMLMLMLGNTVSTCYVIQSSANVLLHLKP